MLGRILKTENILNLLLVFVPFAVALRLAHASPLAVFGASCLAIIPLAGLMGRATEALSLRAGPGIGGLMNATFGNAAELIIAFMALRANQIEIVKASITGSIIGNLLFVLGLAVFFGCLKRERLSFNRAAAGIYGSMLFLGVVALVIPTFLAPELQTRLPAGLTPAEGGRLVEERLRFVSEWIAIVLLLVYGLKCWFSLKTHHHLFNEEAEHEETEIPHWGVRSSVGVLVAATALTAVVAEMLVAAVEHTVGALGLSPFFVGIVVIAIIGNAAEHSTAVLVAIKGKMNLALTIAVESSIQIALFVAPALVFLGELFPKNDPMTLHFRDFEVFGVALGVGATVLISLDGETNWLEGIQLLAVYTLLAIAFFFV